MTSSIWSDAIARRLEALRAKRRLRELRAVQPQDEPHVVEHEGKRLRCFSSNDYLGLSTDRRVADAAQQIIARHGNGPRGAPLVCGHTTLHARLEAELAALKGAPSALLFPTGFAANVGAITALASPDLAIFSDELNHASIIDGCRQAKAMGATVSIYRHRDVDDLRAKLGASEKPLNLIVSDGVFSMDGTVAPVAELVALKHEFGALLMVDDAHGTLVFGERGGGVASAAGVDGDVDLTVVTLGKAIGSFGGAVATGVELRTLLLNAARTYVFSTALPLPVVASALAALGEAASGERRRELWSRIDQAADALGLPAVSPILPVDFGDEAAALAASSHLLDRGFWVPAIRPPTVPAGTSRLRVTLSASHRPEDVTELTEAIVSYRTAASAAPQE